MKRTLLLVMCLFFAGCGEKATEDNFKKIKVGMTEKEVIEILGKPQEVLQPAQYKEFGLKNFEYGNESRIVFEKNKVNAVVVKDVTILTKEDGTEIAGQR